MADLGLCVSGDKFEIRGAESADYVIHGPFAQTITSEGQQWRLNNLKLKSWAPPRAGLYAATANTLATSVSASIPGAMCHPPEDCCEEKKFYARLLRKFTSPFRAG